MVGLSISVSSIVCAYPSLNFYSVLLCFWTCLLLWSLYLLVVRFCVNFLVLFYVSISFDCSWHLPPTFWWPMLYFNHQTKALRVHSFVGASNVVSTSAVSMQFGFLGFAKVSHGLLGTRFAYLLNINFFFLLLKSLCEDGSQWITIAIESLVSCHWVKML